MTDGSGSGRTGWAGLVVTALVAALVSFGVTALLGGNPSPPPAPGTSPEAKSLEALRDEVTGLRAELRRVRESSAPPATAQRNPVPSPAEGQGPGPAPAPEGALPSTRADLVTLIDARIAEKGPAAGVPSLPPRKRVSLEEAGEEMGLSTVEIDAVRRAYREAETEMITCLMGTADLEAIKEEAEAAREDPEKKEALVKKIVGNGIRNVGKILTVEDRRDRELKRFLTPDQMRKLKGYDLKPVIADADLQGLFNDAGR